RNPASHPKPPVLRLRRVLEGWVNRPTHAGRTVRPTPLFRTTHQCNVLAGFSTCDAAVPAGSASPAGSWRRIAGTPARRPFGANGTMPASPVFVRAPGPRFFWWRTIASASRPEGIRIGFHGMLFGAQFKLGGTCRLH